MNQSRAMKIAHLSDLHICQTYRPQNLRHTKYLIEYAIQESVDHIAITGNITNNSSLDDFEALRKLFDSYNLLNSDKLTLVIGNHDIFGGVHLAEDILAYAQICELTDYNKKVWEFKQHYFETFEGAYFPDPDNILPFAKVINDMALIGLNSVARYLKIKNLFASKGKVNKNQINALMSLLEKSEISNKTKIILIHHHFNENGIEKRPSKNNLLQNIEGRAMRMRKKERLFNLFAKHNIELILHGHLHESVEYRKKNHLFLNAGGTIDGNKRGNLKLNIINISGKAFETEIITINYPVYDNKKVYSEIPVFNPI